MTDSNLNPAPILLLKTKSTPHDGYDEFFSSHAYTPLFIPVLAHQFHTSNLAKIKSLFESGNLNPGPNRKYGGLIFTSQRAVEAFASLLSGIPPTAASKALILYTVGPATARSLCTLRDTHLPYATIHGSEAGTGENLASLILEHYNGLYDDSTEGGDDGQKAAKPPLLFLVGEQRRDIIPKTLLGASGERRIGVEEVVVYQTGVVEGFEGTFAEAVGREGEKGGVVWVVVFSPTGCDAMLRVLEKEKGGQARVFVATIGPTTRDHLVSRFGVEPEVCAKKPSPEGVGSGIEEFMSRCG